MAVGINVGSVFFDVGFNQRGFNSAVNKSANTAQSKFGSAFGTIGKMALAAFSVGAVLNFGKQALQTAGEVESAWIGLNSLADGMGRSFNVAKGFISDFTQDGLVPLNNAVTAYKNLIARGYDDTQIKDILTRFKDAAAFGRQSSYSMGDAIQTATEGLKNENSILVDNVGVTKNVAKMWDEYAKSIGTTANNLTMAQRRQAEYNGIMAETQFQVGDAARAAGTYQGRISQLGAAFTSLKSSVGNALMPLANAVLPVVTTIINAFTKMFNVISAIMAKIFGGVAQQVKSTGSAAAGAATQAADAVGGAGDAAQGAGKDAAAGAKKAKGALAAFDELNSLSDNSDSGGGSGGGGGGSGGGGGGSDTPVFENVDVGDSVIGDTSVLDAFKDKILAIKDAFMGFLDQFGLTDSFTSFVDTVKFQFDSIGVKAQESWQKISAQAKISWDEIVGAIEPLIPSVGNIGFKFGEIFVTHWGEGIKARMGILTSAVTGAMSLISGTAQTLSAFLQPALGSLSDFLNRNTGEIKTRITETWGTVESTVTGYIESYVGTARTVLGGFKDWANTHGTELYNAFYGTWEMIWSGVDMIWSGIQFAFEATFGGMADFLGGYGDSITEAFVGVWNMIWEFISPIWNTISETATNIFGSVKSFFDNNLGTIRDTFKNIWEAIWIIVKNVLDKLKQFWDTWGGTIMAAVQGVMNNIRIVFETVWGLIKNAFQAVLNIIKSILDVFIGLFTGDWERAWNGIKGFFEAIWNGIKGFFEVIWNGIGSFIDNVLNTIANLFSNIWNGIKTAISNVLNGIKATIEKVWDGILFFIINITQSIQNTIQGVWDAISGAVSKAWNGIKDLIRGVWDGIKNIFSGAANIFSDIGSNMIKGLWNGISNLGNWIKEKIGGFFGGVVDWAKGLLGIHSPSRVFAELGEYTVQGYGKGIEDEEDAPQKALEDMFSGVLKTAKGITNSLKDWAMQVTDVFVTAFQSKDMLGGLHDLFLSRLSSMLNAAKQFASEMASTLSGIGTNMLLRDTPALSNISVGAPAQPNFTSDDTSWMLTFANILADILAAKSAMTQSNQGANYAPDTLRMEIDGRVLGETMLDYIIQAADRQGIQLVFTT